MATEILRAPLVGVVMGSKSDWDTHAPCLRSPDRAGHRARGEGRLGPPDPRASVPLRPRGGGSGSRGLDRRRGRGGPLAGDARGDLDACRFWASPSRARSCAGSTRSYPSSRCRGACRSVRWPSVLPARPTRRSWRPRSWPGSIRRSERPWRSSARPKPMPWESRRYEHASGTYERRGERAPVSPRISGGDRQRSIGSDVRPGGAADGLSSRRVERSRGHAGRAGGQLVRHRPRRPLALTANAGRSGGGGDRRVRERLGPGIALARRPSPGSSRLEDALGLAESNPREKLPGPAWHPACPLAAGPHPARSGGGRPIARVADDPQDGGLGL